MLMWVQNSSGQTILRWDLLYELQQDDLGTEPCIGLELMAGFGWMEGAFGL